MDGAIGHSQQKSPSPAYAVIFDIQCISNETHISPTFLHSQTYALLDQIIAHSHRLPRQEGTKIRWRNTPHAVSTSAVAAFDWWGTLSAPVHDQSPAAHNQIKEVHHAAPGLGNNDIKFSVHEPIMSFMMKCCGILSWQLCQRQSKRLLPKKQCVRIWKYCKSMKLVMISQANSAMVRIHSQTRLAGAFLIQKGSGVGICRCRETVKSKSLNLNAKTPRESSLQLLVFTLPTDSVD